MLNDNTREEVKTNTNKAATWVGSVLSETLDTPKGKKVVGYAVIGALIPAIAGFPGFIGGGILVGAILGAVA